MGILLIPGGQALSASPRHPDRTDSLRAAVQADTLLSGPVFRSNLFWAAAAEPNLGFEIAVGRHVTVGANVGLKPWPRWAAWDWDAADSRHWRNFAVVPEVRWWPRYTYDAWFVGTDFIYTHYNVGNVRFPLGLYKDVRDHRLQGSFWGAGLFAGRSWWLGEYWRLEAEAGLAGGLAAYDRFECAHCGTRLGAERKPVIVPKLGLNIAYNILSRTEQRRRREILALADPEILVETLMTPPVAFVVHLREVQAPLSVGDSLSREHPWIIPIADYRPLDYRTRPGQDSVLFVRYPVDSYRLDPEFRGNAGKLALLEDAVRQIAEDPRHDELLVSVVGLASIEGPVDHNDTLSVRRARAVADYLSRNSTLSRRQFEVIGKGETWDWFRVQLLSGGDGVSPEDARRLLDIIDSTSDPDLRERRIRADRRLYDEVVRPLLEDQRTAGYIRVFYGDQPDPATEKLNREVYALIKDRKYGQALRMIREDDAIRSLVEKDAEAANAYGIALWFWALDQGDTAAEQEAVDYVTSAARRGSAAAVHNLEGMDVYGPARKKYEVWLELSKADNNH